MLKQARPEKVHVVWFHSYEQVSRKWEIHYSEKTGGREGGSITKAVNKPAGMADTLSVSCRDSLTVGSKRYTVRFLSAS